MVTSLSTKLLYQKEVKCNQVYPEQEDREKNLNERMTDRVMCEEKGRKILETKTMKKRKNEK